VAPLAVTAQGKAEVLGATAMQKLMPASVFYRGQVASTQLRNSCGIKFSDGYYVLAGLVDTSGYSSGVAAKYQAYFITEVPIQIGGKRLAAGVYGIGFIANNKLVVTDVGAHDVITVDTATDSSLKRPMPMDMAAGSGGTFRLYDGRRYVVISR
ncbi:MAG TPA: hypothetical protein VF730_11645, partial [Terracidiphilus sp.]